MSYLDELAALLGGDNENGDNVNDKASDARIIDDDILETARRQLSVSSCAYWEEPTGTFHGCGARYGCGYAEACIVVDPETGVAAIDIDSHLPLSPENQPTARKIFRRLNKEFIVPGLEVGDNGTMHFVAKDGCDIAGGEDLGSFVGKGMGTIHNHAHMVAQIEAGLDPLEILHSNDD